MKKRLFLTIACDGAGAKITKNRPAIEPYEACVQLDLEIPDAYFKRPQLVAELKVPEPKHDATIKAIATGDIEKAIKDATGLNMSIKVVCEETNENR